MVLIMLMPSLGTIIPVNSEKSDVQEEPWWVDTTVDRNKNGIGDMIEKHIDNNSPAIDSVLNKLQLMYYLHNKEYCQIPVVLPESN